MTNAREISDLAKTLHSEAQKLNSASPAVNALLEHADESLKSADPGIELWLEQFIEPTDAVDLWGDEDTRQEGKIIGDVFYAYQIGYARFGDGFRLASRVVEVQNLKDDRFHDDYQQRLHVQPWFRLGSDRIPSAGARVMPLRNAPMSVRIKALSLISDIFTRLTDMVRARNAAIEKAIEGSAAHLRAEGAADLKHADALETYGEQHRATIEHFKKKK